MTAASASPGLSRRGMLIKKANTWFIAMSLVFMLLGIFAILEPEVAGLAVTILVGSLLIAGGLAHFAVAILGIGVGRAIWKILTGLVYIVGGFFFLTHPLLGLGSLTLVLAVTIFAEALFELIAYFRSRGVRNSDWLLVNALIALLLSGLIWFQWPSSSVWAIGILVGAKLLMTGTSHLAFGLASNRH